ncbi:hypothetical protein DFS34DRAFT_458361 [Phlyctochytrium arcticum]|nr:hypothetical protein DFS34DRAFT_458361 [Phlyctochytrium arcticum]
MKRGRNPSIEDEEPKQPADTSSANVSMMSQLLKKRRTSSFDGEDPTTVDVNGSESLSGDATTKAPSEKLVYVRIEEILKEYDQRLDLPHTTSKFCKLYLSDAFKDVLHLPVDLASEQTLYYRTAACIWVQSRLEHWVVDGNGGISVRPGSTMRLNRLLDTGLLKFEGQVIQTKNLPLVFDEFRRFLETLQHRLDMQIHTKFIQDLSATEAFHKVTGAAFVTFDSAFKALLKFNPGNQRVAALGGGNDSMEHVHRWAWTFFLIGADILNLVPWARDDALLWSLVCILFVGTQVCHTQRRPTYEVIDNLLGEGVGRQKCLANGVDPESDWVSHYNGVRQWLCNKFNVDKDRLSHIEKSAIESVITSLMKHKLTPFKYETDRSTNLPWPFYDGALDSTRLLYSNLEDLSRLYDCCILEKAYEFDPRLFRPYNRAIATPRRFCRTPRVSVTKSASMRNLKSVFARISVFNNSMAATPYTARGKSSKGAPSLEEQRLEQLRFTEGFEREPWDPQTTAARLAEFNVPRNVIDQMHQRTKAILGLFPQDPGTQRYLQYGLKLYLRLFEEFLSRRITKTSETFYMQVYSERQLHRSLIFVAFEIIRVLYKVEGFRTADIQRHTNVHSVALGMVLQMVFCHTHWIPSWVGKRMVELMERVLESEMWACQRVYSLILMALATPNKAPTVSSNTIIHILYGNAAASPAKSDESPELRGIRSFIKEAVKVAKLRLGYLTAELRIESPTAISILEHGFRKEHELGLLQNRHMDVFIMACIYAASKIDGRNVPFRKIIESYSQSPQFDEKTTNSIWLSREQPSVDLITYYNKLFLPKMRGFMCEFEVCLILLFKPTYPNVARKQIKRSAKVKSTPTPSPHCSSPAVRSIPRAAMSLVHNSSSNTSPQPTPRINSPCDSSRQLPTLTPRTQRFSATDSPLSPNCVIRSPSGGQSMRRLFGGSGRPPRLPLQATMLRALE